MVFDLDVSWRLDTPLTETEQTTALVANFGERLGGKVALCSVHLPRRWLPEHRRWRQAPFVWMNAHGGVALSLPSSGITSKGSISVTPATYARGDSERHSEQAEQGFPTSAMAQGGQSSISSTQPRIKNRINGKPFALKRRALLRKQRMRLLPQAVVRKVVTSQNALSATKVEARSEGWEGKRRRTGRAKAATWWMSPIHKRIDFRQSPNSLEMDHCASSHRRNHCTDELMRRTVASEIAQLLDIASC